MDTIAYVYKWTHIPTLKWYVGSRTGKGCHPNDGYICSSRIIKPLIKSNPGNWQRNIIATGSPQEMRSLEETILQTCDAKNDLRSFNQNNIVAPFWSQVGPTEKGRKSISQKARERMKNPYYREVVRKAQTGKIISQEHKEAISKKLKNRKDSPETTLKKQAAQKGRIITAEHAKKIKHAWDNKDHKVKLHCIKCHREISKRLLGKHQWGSRCKEVNLEPKQA